MIDEKQTYTRKEVIWIIEEVFEYFETYSASHYFEHWLNDQWKNWNNWASEELYPDYVEELTETFL